MAASPLKNEDITIPNFGTVPKKLTLEQYTVRYIKCSLDDAEDILLLENIETKGLAGEEIVILVKDKFTWNEKYFVVITYLEKKPD